MDDGVLSVAPVVLCAAAVGVLLVAEWFDAPAVRAPAKLTASSAFVWAGLSWGAMDSAYGFWLLMGLVFCWLGDALLLSSGRTKSFQLGIGAFLLGHVAYALACTRLGIEPRWLLVCGVLAGAGAFGVERWLRPWVPADFSLPIVAYVVVIAGMLTCAGAAALSGGPVLLALGALGFAASDVSVARERFVAPGFVNGAWGLPAYFASQLVLAHTVSLVVV